MHILKQVKETKEKDPYFDDCPICQAMKRAEEQGRNLSDEELKEAFEEARKQGAVVGGKWFDEKNRKSF